MAALIALATTLPLGAPAIAGPASVPGASSSVGPTDVADVYRYLDDPAMTGEGQQPPHVPLRPYADAAAAADGGDVTPWAASLNGDWRLTVHPRPDDVPAGFHAADFDVSDWPIASVPHTWQTDYLDHPMFRNAPTEMWPDDPPRVPRDINPTGAYVRTFDLPSTWDGRRTFLRFEGVTSGYFVWVNGSYVGYDQGGYTPAEFDLTDVVRPGQNRIAVQVHRWGSGSYLEDSDQWRYSGIFRDVTLYSTPQARLVDAHIVTDLDETYTDATVTVRVDVDRTSQAAAGTYPVRAALLDARDRVVTTLSAPANLTGTTAQVVLSGRVPNPAKWSAEQPNLYRLLLELADTTGRTMHVTAQDVGFREIDVVDRQIRVNGVPILIKGVNRTEAHPNTGRYMTRGAQRNDVMLMKKLHINAVRTAHYPADPYFYELADKHGLWVVDEVDIETHNHQRCPSDCLADQPEWHAAFADRFQAMVARDRNHPSVIFWSTGNEAGLGTAHFEMAQWAAANEPTRLLYHQSNSPNGDAPFAAVAGPRYPTPAALAAVAGTTTKPIVMGEYAHAMGNSLGSITEYWDVVRRYPQVRGGFVWDWADANPRQPRYLTPDSSPSGIQAFAVGKPELVTGRRGDAVSLSGLDDFIDVFRDPRLDLTGPLTLDAWVRPGTWSGSFPILTKGQAYGLRMADERTLEFGVDVGTRATVSATVPADWYDTWHRVTGVYDGAALRLYLDGAPVAEAAASGAVRPGLWEVNIGRDAQAQRDDTRTRLAHGLVDDVRIYPTALTAAQLAAGADPYQEAVLALDFDSFDRRGNFVSLGLSLSGADGLVGADRTPQPETVELAWAHSPVRFTALDVAAGRIRVHNEQRVGDPLGLRLEWSLTEVDRVLVSGSQPLALHPGATVDLELGRLPANPDDHERFLNVSVVTTGDLPWAERGWRFAYEQFPAGGQVVPGMVRPSGGRARLKHDGDAVIVAGKDFRYRFDTATGTLTSMRVGGTPLLRGGPELSVYRAPTSGEAYGWGTADRELWHAVGLDRLRTTVTGLDATANEDDGTVTVEVTSRVAAPDTAASLTFEQTMRYVVDGRGSIRLAHRVHATGSAVGSLPYLPRVGFSLRVRDELSSFAYYGRGPAENYNDRSRGSLIGVYHNTVEGEYVPYARPQANGNHTDTRWATLSDGDGAGLLVGALGGDLDVSVSRYDLLDRAEYDFQLPLVRNRNWTTLYVSTIETGVGETPHAAQPGYRAAPGQTYDYTVLLRPLTSAELAAGAIPGPTTVR